MSSTQNQKPRASEPSYQKPQVSEPSFALMPWKSETKGFRTLFFSFFLKINPTSGDLAAHSPKKSLFSVLGGF
jgi:hypothetical protein